MDLVRDMSLLAPLLPHSDFYTDADGPPFNWTAVAGRLDRDPDFHTLAPALGRVRPADDQLPSESLGSTAKSESRSEVKDPVLSCIQMVCAPIRIDVRVR